LRAPRLSSPWREPEEESAFAITTDDLMNTDQIESVASTAAILAFHAGKAVVQVPAIEIAIDHLLDIGPPEAVLT
jgi:hypothetical protein